MSLLLCLFVFFKQHQEMSLKQKVINGTVIRTGDIKNKKELAPDWSDDKLLFCKEICKMRKLELK